ncbi:UDP-glycosyltransferase 43, partial [Glycine soja]
SGHPKRGFSLTKPLGEQELNAYRMVREFGLAVELKVDYRRGSDLVMAEEIEKGFKQLMLFLLVDLLSFLLENY